MNQLNRRKKKMKSFKQFDLNEDGQYTDRFAHTSVEDESTEKEKKEDEKL